MSDTVFELAPDRLEAARPLFAAATFDRAFVDAFFEGHQTGRLFVDDLDTPTGALLCRSYDYFLAGTPASSLRRFIADAPAEASVFETLSDLRIAREQPTIAFYGFVPLTEAWRDALLADLPGLETIGRRDFSFPPDRVEQARQWMERVPEGFTIHPIDRELARRIDDELDELIALFWGDYDRFAANGFGACAMAGNEIASVNYAIAVSSREANIGVATVEQYQRRGLATAVSLVTVAQATERGLTPTWDCDTANEASARLAIRLGFIEEPPFVELAFPHRAGPERSHGLWSRAESPAGPIWTRR